MHGYTLLQFCRFGFSRLPRFWSNGGAKYLQKKRVSSSGLSIMDQGECGIVGVNDAVVAIQRRVLEVSPEHGHQLPPLHFINLSQDGHWSPQMAWGILIN